MPAESAEFRPRAVRRRRVAVALIASDAVALGLAMIAATLVQGGALDTTGSASLSTGLQQVAVFAAFALAAAFSMGRARLYDADKLGWGSGEFTRVLRSLVTGAIVVLVGLFLTGLPHPSRESALLVLALGSVLVVAGRMLLRFAESRLLRRDGWLLRPTLIVGSNVEAAELTRLLQSNPRSGLVPVGCLRSSLKDRLSFDYCAPLLETLGSARDLSRTVTERGIDTVIIIGSAFDYEVVKRMLKELSTLPVSVHLSSALSEVLSSRVATSAVVGVPLSEIKGLSKSPAAVASKRAFDLVVGGLIVLLGMPVWAILALLVKITSEGPVFYKQERIGRDGVPFLMYKFRSMVVDAEKRLEELRSANEADGPLFKIKHDPRCTSVGRWMRKLSLDEFPQLINVLRGDMSLVGPRPPLPNEIPHYTEQDWRRLETLPGMTGLWQVSGRSGLTFREMVRLDVFYIDNWSLGLDASLMVRTLPAVLRTRGAC